MKLFYLFLPHWVAQSRNLKLLYMLCGTRMIKNMLQRSAHKFYAIFSVLIFIKRGLEHSGIVYIYIQYEVLLLLIFSYTYNAIKYILSWLAVWNEDGTAMRSTNLLRANKYVTVECIYSPLYLWNLLFLFVLVVFYWNKGTRLTTPCGCVDMARWANYIYKYNNR